MFAGVGNIKTVITDGSSAKAQAEKRSFSNPPKSPWEKGDLKGITDAYQRVLLPPFSKAGQGGL
jgi:hypothetical protein